MINFFRLLLITTTYSLLLSACSVHNEIKTVIDIQPDKSIIYRTAGNRDLRLHIFLPKTNHQARANGYPAALFFFGGGWNGGTPSQLYPQSNYLTKLGMIAIAAEYRTHSSDLTPPIVSLLDAKAAMRYISSHAKELNIDPNSIVVGGASAGGHLAAALSVTPAIEEQGADRQISLRPRALILFNPVIDNGAEGYGFDRVQPYWRAFSPLHNIEKDYPPTLFFQGTQDRHTPVSTAQAFKQAIENKGGEMELHLYEGETHGFFNQSRSQQLFEDTMTKSKDFLIRQGILD